MNLKNRFPDEVRAGWIDHYSCFICGQNTADCLHHIISPANDHYIPGDYNKSIFNSAPMCNHRCHLYNPELHKEYKTRELLRKTYRTLQRKGYELKDRDIEFLVIYKHLYE